MSNSIFAFTLHTKSNIKSGVVCDANGNVAGRIISKYPKFKDEWEEMMYDGLYTYDVETLRLNSEKIRNREIILSLDDYSVDDCSTSWIRGNSK